MVKELLYVILAVCADFKTDMRVIIRISGRCEIWFQSSRYGVGGGGGGGEGGGGAFQDI